MKFKTALFFALLFVSALGYAQNTAFVSKDKLFSQLKGYTARQAALDTLRVHLSKDIQKEQQGIQNKYQELIKPYSPKQDETLEALVKRLSKVDAEKFSLLQEEQKMHDTRIKTYNRQVDEQYARDLKPYMVQVETALQQYGKKNKTDMIWYLEDVVRSLPYYDKSRDITAAIAESVNKMLP